MATAFNHRQQQGYAAELFVAQWLTKQGYTILEHNFRLRCGEIDIIAKNQDILAFVEVKFRTLSYFQTSQVVIPSKQQKIIKTAKYYIMQKNITQKTYRFDIALVHAQNTDFGLEYIPNAFTECTSY